MKLRENTIQQLDPLSATSAVGVRLLGSGSIVGYAISMTYFNRHEVDNLSAALLSLLLILASCATFLVTSDSLRAPLTRSHAIVAVALALLAYLAATGSVWLGNTLIRDDWGPVVMGVLLVMLAPYRPVRELLVLALACAVVVSTVTLLQVPALVSPAPSMVFVVVAVTPIVALAAAGASYSFSSVRGLLEWGAQSREAAVRFLTDNTDGVVRSVQQGRLTIIERDVVPFLSDVLRRNEVTAGDQLRSREIADSIRRIMVAEVDRTWLGVVVGAAAASRGVVDSASVDDESRAAERMNTDQRAALRAFVIAALDTSSLGVTGLSVRLVDDGRRVVVRLVVSYLTQEQVVRSVLSPYFAVLRVLFERFEVTFHDGALALKFSYDQL